MIIPSTPKTGQVPQCKWKSTKMLELKLSMKYNEVYNSVNIYKKPFYWLAIWTHQILALETTPVVIWVLKISFPKIFGPMGWNMAWPMAILVPTAPPAASFAALLAGLRTVSGPRSRWGDSTNPTAEYMFKRVQKPFEDILGGPESIWIDEK